MGIAIHLRNVTNLTTIADPKFAAPDGLRLLENEVQLWRIELETMASPEARWRKILSADELARADRFHFPRDRQNFTATRALLRILLGQYLGCAPEAVTFIYGKREKPVLHARHAAAGVHFNVSHSGTKALLAFAHAREVGVDIEQIRENFDHQALARRFFSPAEQQALADLAPSKKCRGFFRCWTRKEAYIKAHGAGLSLPLHAFDVSLACGEQNALLATRPDAGEAGLWLLREVHAGPGYEAALCVRGQDWILTD